jgi:hypothetical protein
MLMRLQVWYWRRMAQVWIRHAAWHRREQAGWVDDGKWDWAREEGLSAVDANFRALECLGRATICGRLGG